jgi:hypothetical protein
MLPNGEMGKPQISAAEEAATTVTDDGAVSILQPMVV